MPDTEKRRPIIGVDFDDTLFRHSYPADDSEPNWAVINYVRHRQKEGAYLILVTCRHKAEDIRFAVNACRNVGIEFDAVNQNLPFMIEALGDCRKVYCNEYIDDKNITIQQIESMEPITKAHPVYVVIGLDEKFSLLMHKLKQLDGISVVTSTVAECVPFISDMVDSGFDIDGISIDESEWTPEVLDQFSKFVFRKTNVERIDIRHKKN